METQELLCEERIKQVETELRNAHNLINCYRKEHEDFIMIASHDLQAPLRKLSTFVERLIYKFKEVKGDEVNNYVERIQSILAGMRRMIDSLSVFSYASESKPGFTKCNLNEILQNVLKDIHLVNDENNVTITSSPLPVIEGNAAQLKSLFENIIHNAIKFQKKDTALQIEISAGAITEEDKKAFDLNENKIYHKILITDNGIGFDEQYSEKIFQPFVHLHGKSEYEGDGFGLALCKKIIEKHQGFIYAASSKNSGARFTFIFPETHN
jgi:light-regulated signal transduction histidine kinase (bacteriophytochrome)